MEIMARLQPLSYAYYIVSSDEREKFNIKSYLGHEFVGTHFLKSVKEDCLELYVRLFDRITPIKMTAADELRYQSENACYVCKEPFSEDSGMENDHFDGWVLN